MSRRTVLHVAEILAWADEYRKRTGKFPTADSGVVVANPDEKWANINQALRVGLRGFPGRWSLAQLLAERRGHRNRKRLPKYTLAEILGWADAHQRRTGHWPTSKSGPIKEAPGETWLAVAIALSHGRRGLRGGSSLASLLAKHRRVRNRASIPDLSISRILRWADAHKARTGNWPWSETGPVHECPAETWCAIDQALKAGSRGLPRRSSLSRLLRKYRGVGRHARHPPLSFDQILRWADAYRTRTGHWPKAKSGRIPESKAETWLRVQTALYQGKRCLPAGWSLAKLLAKHRGVRNHLDLPPLSDALILRWVRDHQRRTGTLPKRDSGPIPNSKGEKWNAVDSALRAGRRGLRGGSSLARFVARNLKRGQLRV